jgi:hypothetical protein
MPFSDYLRRFMHRLAPAAPVAEPLPPPLESEKNARATAVLELNRQLAAGYLGWPPGHFYSAIPDLFDIWQREDAVFPSPRPELPGIQLQVESQLELLRQLEKFQAGLTFPAKKQPGLRYYSDNPNFTQGDGAVLYCMLQFLAPKHVIEIGSGFSSCLVLDINESVFQGGIACSFIEPHAELLLDLVKPEDQFALYRQPVQSVDLDLFTQLGPGDILLVDSSHVSKVGSDVNHIFFEILPRLRPGVYVHFHDAWYDFQYPKKWIYEGRVWNEAYLLRAFLQYNNSFSIEFFSAYLGKFHQAALGSALPLTREDPGTSLWLRKTS